MYILADIDLKIVENKDLYKNTDDFWKKIKKKKKKFDIIFFYILYVYL